MSSSWGARGRGLLLSPGRWRRLHAAARAAQRLQAAPGEAAARRGPWAAAPADALAALRSQGGPSPSMFMGPCGRLFLIDFYSPLLSPG
jgi:hypothetical protein